MRLLPFRTHIALVVALAAPASSAFAQAPVERPATHTVKKGDTLWDLAHTYLGDAFQWPQIYRLNTDIIKDPHWIYPGQVFKLPGGSMGTAEVVRPAAPTAPAAPETPVSRTSRPSSMTVFNPAYNSTGTRTRVQALTGAPHTAVRAGDFEAAPFMWSVGGPVDGGTLDATDEPAGLTMTHRLRPIQFAEAVYATMPAGVTASVGQVLLVYRMGDVVPGQGQVVIPTGELKVTRIMDGRRVRADVVKKFEDIYLGNGVVVLDRLSMPFNVFPTRVEFGIATQIAWLYNDPKLAGPGGALILSAKASDGLVSGDQVTMRRPRTNVAPGELPDEDIAVAQITRVTPWGASAVILSIGDAGMKPGVRAQVTAKMP
jgi:LysM repeat protein